MRGQVKYIPGELYPDEATVLSGRYLQFRPGNFLMNQVPEGDVMMRERVIPSERRLAPLNPRFSGKEGVDAGSGK